MSQRNVPEDRVPAEDRDPAVQWVRSIRTEFIERVSLPFLNTLLDRLFEFRVIYDSEMRSARSKPENERAREVVDTVRNKGAEACRVLIEALSEKDPYFYNDLVKSRGTPTSLVC
ncbi:Caspase-1 [Dissostichus eleginoides]|uniref:Caspase-1 n=1 Tax=Dissostichus eleginoides TaxID=100907 RepID=A0AAD9BFS6_DISEL|nr:Caspase-1 [Dissostichus eleginoides]